MVLGIYDYVYGIAQLAAGFLAIVAGFIAVSLFSAARKKSNLAAWRWLLLALVIFTVVEVIGGLTTFGFDIASYWTHVLTSVILALLIIALVVQIHLNKGWKE